MPKTSRLIARTSKWISLSMGRCLILNHKIAVLRILACFLFTTDSWGKPYSSLLRYFTSTNLNALFFLNMRSISPNRQRKLWAIITAPFFFKNARAKRSPFLPVEVELMLNNGAKIWPQQAEGHTVDWTWSVLFNTLAMQFGWIAFVFVKPIHWIYLMVFSHYSIAFDFG